MSDLTVMTTDAAGMLDLVESNALEHLVSPAAKQHIERLARTIPIGVHTACYECFLSESAERVDLAVCVFPSFASDPKAGAALDAALETYAGDADWRKTLAFLSEWARPESPLRPRIPFVWLAFDYANELPALAAPCVGLCVDRSFLVTAGREPTPADLPDLDHLANTCARYFFDQPLSEAARDRLCSCLSTLTVVPKHFSYMLGRSSRPFKLDVRLDVEHVARLLRGIGWPGDAAAVTASIRQFMPWPGQVQLNLTLDPVPTQPLEVEFMTGACSASEGARDTFLDRLVKLGLCASSKAETLRRLRAQPLTAGGRRARAFYFKVRFDEATAIEAKAYLGVIARTPA
jgi:hypothetical protein